MGEKLDKVLEGFKPIPMKRMFYPRGMKLSEDFVNAFHREYDRLVGEGLNPKSLVERFGKAMRFHQNEERKYIKLDEEKASQDRRTKEGDHAPSEEGGGQDGHTGKGRQVTRAERDKEMEKLHKQLANEKPDEYEGDRGERKREGLKEGTKKKKSRKKGGTYGMGDSHGGDGGDD